MKTGDSGTYDANSQEDDDCIVFVHGWRMQTWERRSFASTSYKRMWQAGYKGRFFHFSWPTEWTNRRSGVFWDYIGNPPADADNYADSEEKAYHSGEGLHAFLLKLKQEYGASNVRMFAHSMGNVVASEAMRKHSMVSGGGSLIHTYAPCQAAMAAHAYDPQATPRPVTVYNNFLWDTPENYADYPYTSDAYYEDIGSTGAVVNFHNVGDDALNGWTKGQDFKPNDGAGIPITVGPLSGTIPISPDEGYDYEILPVKLYYHVGPPRRNMIYPHDTYEIYAHSAEARCFALGAGSVPAFTSVDLSNGFSKASYNFGVGSEDHSAQFRGTNMIRHEFWERLLDEFGLAPEGSF